MLVSLDYLVPNLPKFPREIVFQGVILNSWKNYDGQHLHYYVRWTPLNILNDEWIIADFAKITCLRKKVKICDMNTKQRRILCEKIMDEKRNKNKLCFNNKN